jgi:hypothetical protein
MLGWPLLWSLRQAMGETVTGLGPNGRSLQPDCAAARGSPAPSPDLREWDLAEP